MEHKKTLSFWRLFATVTAMIFFSLGLGLAIGYTFWPLVFGEGLEATLIVVSFLILLLFSSFASTCLLYWARHRSQRRAH